MGGSTAKKTRWILRNIPEGFAIRHPEFLESLTCHFQVTLVSGVGARAPKSALQVLLPCSANSSKGTASRPGERHIRTGGVELNSTRSPRKRCFFGKDRLFSSITRTACGKSIRNNILLSYFNIESLIFTSSSLPIPFVFFHHPRVSAQAFLS